MVVLDAGLVMYLKMSEGSGSIVKDRSKQGNHGAVSGAIFLRPFEDMSNDSDDEGAQFVIYDDDETFWTLNIIGGGTIVINAIAEELTIVKKGSSSLEMSTTGGGADLHWYIAHAYGAAQDWSHKDYATFWWYGANTGASFILRFWCPDAINRYGYGFTDNFTGWRRFIIPLKRFSTEIGAPDWADVNKVEIWMNDGNVIGTWYLDRTTIDTGNWRFGEALDFDGTNDVVTIADSPSLSIGGTDMTISAWVNISAYAFTIIANKGATAAVVDGYILYLDGSGKLIFSSQISGETGTITSTNSVPLDTMVHVVGVRTSNSIRVYINGIVDGETAVTGAIPFNANPVHIAYWGAYALYTPCIIDEIRIYNRILSPEEIRTLYKKKY